jgi:hypothetical protein
MSVENILAKLENQEKPEDLTVKGVAEAAVGMTVGIFGAFAGTVEGVGAVVQDGDIKSYSRAFEETMAPINEDILADMSPEGLVAMEKLESLWSKWVTGPTEKYLVDPNIENDNPLLATIGKVSGEGLPMFAMLEGPKAVQTTTKGIKSLTSKTLQKVRRSEPSAKEVLVDVETGEPVITPDAPLSDKGVHMEMFKEFVKITRDPSVSPHEGMGRILKPLFYKPVQVIKDWKSPTLTRMAERIFASTKADSPIEGARRADLIDMSSKAWGRASQRFDAIIEPVKGRLNTIPREAGEAITRGLRTGKVPKQYREVTLQIKEFTDQLLHDYIRPVLPDIGEVPNYAPQVWNVPHILKYPQRFLNKLISELKFDKDAAQSTLRKIVEADGSPEFYETTGRLVDASEVAAWSGRIKQLGGASIKSFEKSRKINIPEEALPVMEEFLVNNAGDLFHTYIRNVTKRVEYARLFGPKEEILNSAVAQGIKELGIENNIKAVKELTADVYGLADALQGKYRPIQSLSLNKWNRRIANYETVLHLGLVSLASFPEMAAPAIQFGFVPRAYVKGFAHALIEATGAAERVLRGKRSVPKLKAAKALEEMGAISLTPIQSILASRFTNISSAFTSRFMHATGLELLTDTQKVIAYETINTILQRNAKYLIKGKSGKKAEFYKGQLRELGIEPEQAMQWIDEGMPQRGPLSNIVENTKLRGQRWAVTMPNAATKPLIFSDPHFTNLLLFKSFNSVFSNLFMKRALGELFSKQTLTSRQAGIISGMAAATGIAYYTQFLREMIAGYDTKMSQADRLTAAFDRAALTGTFTYAFQLINPYRFGFTDSSAKRLFNLLGPAVGDTARIIDVLSNPDLSDKQRAKELARLVPVTNIVGGSREATAEVIEELLP